MVSAFIFFIHIIFALIICTKKWQDENLSSGFINLALIGVLFAVGWSVAGIIAKLVLTPEGFGKEFNRDAFSLSILTIAEYFFYRFYYKEEPTSADKGTQ
jgi:hypothetical protein